MPDTKEIRNYLFTHQHVIPGYCVERENARGCSAEVGSGKRENGSSQNQDLHWVYYILGCTLGLYVH